MHRFFKSVLILLALAALTTACGDRVHYEQHQTPDGRTVECFVYHAGTPGGISCNWPGRQ